MLKKKDYDALLKMGPKEREAMLEFSREEAMLLSGVSRTEMEKWEKYIDEWLAKRAP